MNNRYLLSICEHIPEALLAGLGVDTMQLPRHSLNSAGIFTLTTHIDPTRHGNVARFFNHSCSPNLMTRTFRVDSLLPAHVGLFASRDIEADEELTFSYGEVPANREELLRPCHCGSNGCKKFLPFDDRFS